MSRRQQDLFSDLPDGKSTSRIFQS